MTVGFVGTGAHWRVLPLRKVSYAGPLLREYVGAWQVYRRHWDHWEVVGAPPASGA